MEAATTAENDNQNSQTTQGYEAESVEVTLQRMRDEGISEVAVNRIRNLIGAFGGDVEAFCRASKGALMTAYSRMVPDTPKSIGTTTFRAFDKFVAYQRASRFDTLRVAEEEVKLLNEKKQITDEARAAALSERIDLKILSDVVAWYSTAFPTAQLGEIVSHYHRMAELKKEQA